MLENTDCRFCLDYWDCKKKPSENSDVKPCSGFTHFLTPLQESLKKVKAGEYAIV